MGPRLGGLPWRVSPCSMLSMTDETETNAGGQQAFDSVGDCAQASRPHEAFHHDRWRNPRVLEFGAMRLCEPVMIGGSLV